MINKRRNRFTFVLLLIVFCFASLLPAAADAKDKKKTAAAIKKKLKKIPLRITSMPDPKNTTPAAKVAIALQNEFLRRYPEIELSKFSGISIANIGWESKLMLAIAGGAAPDILPLNFRMSDTYIQQNFMYPLDDYVKAKYGSIEKYLATLPPAVRPVLYREGPGIGHFKKGKHIWGLNHYVSTRALFWRKDLFQDVGLDPEKPPKTWEEFLNYAESGRFVLIAVWILIQFQYSTANPVAAKANFLLLMPTVMLQNIPGDVFLFRWKKSKIGNLHG